MNKIVTNRIYRLKDGGYRAVVTYYDNYGAKKRKDFKDRKKNRLLAKINSFSIKLNVLERENANDKRALSKADEVMKEYVENYRKNNLKRTSIDTIESTVKNHILPFLKDFKVYEIKTDDIQKFLNLESRAYSTSTVKKVYLEINLFFEYLYKNEVIAKNPVTYCTYNKTNHDVDNEKVKVYSHEEIKKMKEIINNEYISYKDAQIFTLILNTGIREGEALAIKNSDIDIDNRRLTIKREVSEVKRRDLKGNAIGGIENVIEKPKSKTSIRTIPLNDEAIKAINILRGDNYNESDYLLHYSNGSFVTNNALRKRFKKLTESAGIPNLGIHALRHTFATILINDYNKPVKAVSRILGHSTTEITERTYVHNINDVNIEGFDKLVI